MNPMVGSIEGAFVKTLPSYGAYSCNFWYDNIDMFLLLVPQLERISRKVQMKSSGLSVSPVLICIP